MTESDARVELGRTDNRPGDELAGAFVFPGGPPADAESVELLVLWHTSGGDGRPRGRLLPGVGGRRRDARRPLGHAFGMPGGRLSYPKLNPRPRSECQL